MGYGSLTPVLDCFVLKVFPSATEEGSLCIFSMYHKEQRVGILRDKHWDQREHGYVEIRN